MILIRPDGSTLTLEKTYKDFKEPGTAIEEEVTHRLLPGALAAYNAGSPVNFGSILVSYQGLSVQNGQKMLPWNEFKAIKVYDGRVSIKKQGARLDWAKLLIPQVPNLCVPGARTADYRYANITEIACAPLSLSDSLYHSAEW